MAALEIPASPLRVPITAARSGRSTFQALEGCSKHFLYWIRPIFLLRSWKRGSSRADAVVKGQTASSSYKPAILENGVKVMVPPHITTGTRIVVSTVDSTYVERAKD